MRNSGRISKEIPILLIGSDLAGKLFSEHTKTVLLSLHGAGLVSKHKLSPEQELLLRWPERNKEAEIRVVGQVGSDSGSYTYGVAFLDPSLNFWEVEFPPLTPAEREASLLLLVCDSCKTLENVDGSAIEADVCATNEGVLRFCKRCGCSTLWKPAASVIIQESVSAEAAQLPLFSPSPAPPLAPAQASSPPSAPSQATAVLTPVPSKKPGVPPVNRRKHPRIKVNYSACIHRPGFEGDDVVQCEDMSRGGLRFKSSKRYFSGTFIEVAVPYNPGQPAIFVPAQIVFVAELPEQKLFRCGVAFLKSTKPRDSF